MRANGFIFVSGQLPIDPASGQLAEGDATAQTKVVLENLKAILEPAGSLSGQSGEGDHSFAGPERRQGNLWEIFLFGSAGVFDGRSSPITKAGAPLKSV